MQSLIWVIFFFLGLEPVSPPCIQLLSPCVVGAPLRVKLSMCLAAVWMNAFIMSEKSTGEPPRGVDPPCFFFLRSEGQVYFLGKTTNKHMKSSGNIFDFCKAHCSHHCHYHHHNQIIIIIIIACATFVISVCRHKQETNQIPTWEVGGRAEGLSGCNLCKHPSHEQFTLKNATANSYPTSKSQRIINHAAWHVLFSLGFVFCETVNRYVYATC